MCIKKNNRVLECECMPPAVHIAHIESGYATVECPAHKLLYNAYHFWCGILISWTLYKFVKTFLATRVCIDIFVCSAYVSKPLAHTNC